MARPQRADGPCLVRQVFREHGPRMVAHATAWFRAQESNLRFWVQRPASCQLDDPGVTRAACTRHTSPGRSGGNRTLTTSIKSRVRLPITLRTRIERAGMPRVRGRDTRDCRRRGTRRSRTFIPRGKSPVLGQIELASRAGWKEPRLYGARKPQIPSLRNMIEPRGESRTVRRARMGRRHLRRMGRPPRGPGRSAGEGSPTGRITCPPRQDPRRDRPEGRARRAIESQKREKPPRGLPRAVFEFGS